MAVSDIFPLTPDYPLEVERRSRKVEIGMESGKVYKRSKGTDLWRSRLQGTAPSADITTLINFFEQQAKDVFTFQDKSFASGQIDRICVFRGPLAYTMTAYEYFRWEATVEETTTA